MYNIGIDIGSVATKIVVMKEDKLIDYTIAPSGWSPKENSEKIINELLDTNNINKEEVKSIVATGYGRISIPFANKKVTEITCHGKGAKYLFNNTKTIIDIGGQDSKVITLDDNGNVSDFIMNDKCAAGTGRFLEVMCIAMGIDINELSNLAYNGKPIKINSMCTVFAESEIISLKSKGTEKEDIASGLIHSVVDKVSALASKMRLEDEVFFTGGLSNNDYLKDTLEKKLNKKIKTSEYAQLAGAIGAALLG